MALNKITFKLSDRKSHRDDINHKRASMIKDGEDLRGLQTTNLENVRLMFQGILERTGRNHQSCKMLVSPRVALQLCFQNKTTLE